VFRYTIMPAGPSDRPPVAPSGAPLASLFFVLLMTGVMLGAVFYRTVAVTPPSAGWNLSALWAGPAASEPIGGPDIGPEDEDPDALALAVQVENLESRLAQIEAVAEVTGLMALGPGRAELAPEPAADLGARIEALLDRVARLDAVKGLLDTLSVERAAGQQRLPTLQPVSDHPYLSSGFGWRRHPLTGERTLHEGIDFAAAPGTPILAAAPGRVVRAGDYGGYGKMVDIDHGNGLVTRYAHASVVRVRVGQLVRRGQRLGDVGSSGRSTGSHLHFEVRIAGQAVDPRLFLGQLPKGPQRASGS